MTDVAARPAVRHEQLFIAGVWRDAADGATWTRFGAGSSEPSAVTADATAADAHAAITAARDAFDVGPWPKLTGRERARVLLDAAAMLRSRRDEVAAVEAAQVGKPFRYALGDVDGSVDLLEYYAGLARTVSGRTVPSVSTGIVGLTLQEPVGVCAMIVAWNFPLLLACQKLAPALAAGCTAVVKPAPSTPSSILMLAEILDSAGLPPGALNVLTEADPGQRVGPILTESPLVDKISFTGSTKTAELVLRGAAATMKRVSIEAGGKSPHIVHHDADLDAAAEQVANAIFFNTGQVCIAGSRLLAHSSISGELLDRVKVHAEALTVGDPFAEETDLGPLVNERQVVALRNQLAAAAASGASFAVGGPEVDERGFARPTVIEGLAPDDPLARDELFGPVLSTFTFDTLNEAIALANDTPFGLAAGVWTSSIDTALSVARRVRAGTVWVNTFLTTFPELPHGGFGLSGLGRELGPAGLAAYLEEKTVQIRHHDPVLEVVQ